MRFLVVESSPTARRAVVQALTSMRDAVSVVADQPREAMEALDQPYSVAVVGWSPDDDDALELVRALRAHPEQGEVRVVLLTSRAEEADVRRALEAGIDDYLLRPVAPAVLRARIAKLLPEDDADGAESERRAA